MICEAMANTTIGLEVQKQVPQFFFSWPRVAFFGVFSRNSAGRSEYLMPRHHFQPERVGEPFGSRTLSNDAKLQNMFLRKDEKREARHFF